MISVVMCSHDPRPAYIAESLESLRSQTLQLSEWELVLVDNLSASPLQEIVDLTWHPQARVVREETLGLTAARLRGIRGTTGSLLVFVDDDNILDTDYLERASAIADSHPHLGAWGGQSRPRFEVSPPEWTRRFWGNLVIRELDRDSWSNIYYLHETLPAGAGLCVRREVARRYNELNETGNRSMMLDRSGTQLLSGGDTDLVLCALDLGMGSGTFRALGLVHIIPSSRLEEKYLVELTAGIAYSAVILRSFRPDEYPPETRRGFATKVADTLRAVRQDARERRVQRAVRVAVERARRDLASHQRVTPA